MVNCGVLWLVSQDGSVFQSVTCVAYQVEAKEALVAALEGVAPMEVLAALIAQAEGAGLPASVVEEARAKAEAQWALQEALASGASPEALTELIARAEAAGNRKTSSATV